MREDDARHLLLIPYPNVENPEILGDELEKIQLSEPRDHLNNMRQIPNADSENKMLQVFRAKGI